MHKNHPLFDQRLKRLGHEHSAAPGGFAKEMRLDGHVVTRTYSPFERIPFGYIAGLVAGFFLFKAALIVAVGAATYDTRVQDLRQGNLLEYGGAILMQADPASEYLAHKIRPLLR